MNMNKQCVSTIFFDSVVTVIIKKNYGIFIKMLSFSLQGCLFCKKNTLYAVDRKK